MRTIGRSMLIVISALLCSCTDYNASSESYTKQCKRIIGESDKWKVIQVNDTVVVCIPCLNTDNAKNPVVINLLKVK